MARRMNGRLAAADPDCGVPGGSVPEDSVRDSEAPDTGVRDDAAAECDSANRLTAALLCLHSSGG